MKQIIKFFKNIKEKHGTRKKSERKKKHGRINATEESGVITEQ